MRWRVRNGESIRVWHDPWIPGTQSRKVISPSGLASREMVVGSLINPILKTWNIEVISQLFLPFEQERILSIPLSSRLPDDCLCWDLERDGVYSVRSAYRALIDDKWRGEEVASYEGRTIWNKVWKLKVLPRVKVLYGGCAMMHCLLARS